MHKRTIETGIGVLLSGLLICGGAAAKLPAPTPAQQQAAADKKAQAAAQTEKEKQELTATMDKITARWRSRAASNGWQTHAPTAVAATPPAAATAQGAANASPVPIRSEKAGTAEPSADVKQPARQGPPDKIK